MDDDAERVLAHLADSGGELRASANLDPQWNAATAETKHRQDLALRLHDAARLDRGPDAVEALLEDLAGHGLVERTATADGATVRLTDAGAAAAGGDGPES